MTDNEIVKALECCMNDDEYCRECPYVKSRLCQESLIKDAFYLINRLKVQADTDRSNLELAMMLFFIGMINIMNY